MSKRACVIGLGALLSACGGNPGVEASEQQESTLVEGRSEPIPPPAGVKKMFVTRATFSGDLDGLAGADQKCQIFAEAAGLTGVWRAWLSHGEANAIDRIKSEGPWWPVGRAGPAVFPNRAGLRGFPRADWSFDEIGAALTDREIWTGTRITGVAAADSDRTCDGWDYRGSSAPPYGLYGKVGATGEEWTAAGTDYCVDKRSLLCLEDQ